MEDDVKPLSSNLTNLPEDQVEFLKHYEAVCQSLPWEPNTQPYHDFHDHLSAMLAQANTWGYERAQKES